MAALQPTPFVSPIATCLPLGGVAGLRTLFRLLSRDTPGVCSAVERVCLSGCLLLTDSGLSAVARRCPQLRTLEVRGCSQVTDVGVSEVVTRCLNLSRLDVTGERGPPTVAVREPLVPAPLGA